MQLSNTTLKKLIHGAYDFKMEKGYLSFCRFSQAQMDFLAQEDGWCYERALHTGGISAKFLTDATSISFDYKLTRGELNDTIDVYVDDKAYYIHRTQEQGLKGKIELALPMGKKQVTIYFPTDSDVWIKRFNIDGKWRAVKPAKTKLLFIGDSITQGVGSGLSGQTYVHVFSRIHSYHVLNQGISGHYHDGRLLLPLDEFKPDKIIIAMGTNDYNRDSFDLTHGKVEDRIPAFYKRLNELYGDVPKLLITPLWRADAAGDLDKFKAFCKRIANEALQYKNVTVVDGMDLVPPVAECFHDGLHPSCWGMELYGKNLANKVTQLKF